MSTRIMIALAVSIPVFTIGFPASPSYGQTVTCADGLSVNPFADNNGTIPAWSDYKGPYFQLSHDYPTQPPAAPVKPPWLEALNGQPISGANAGAYVNALKAYVAEDMKTLIYDYKNWDAAKVGWYNSPWLYGSREPIHGAYTGSTLVPNVFPKSKLKKTMTTWVLPYYDSTAAYQLRQVWGDNASVATVSKTIGQYPEGAVIIKAAFTTASPRDWPPMKGAYPWKMFIPRDELPDGQGPTGPVVVRDVYLFQFDIIVKDSITVPDTGWVFTTLVYDGTFSGSNWDQMIPLGAMWGNDPGVIPSNSGTNPPLNESWINPKAPVYSKETLAWGGRLSGPNDQAYIAPAYVDGNVIAYQPVDSCMGCHGSAEYPAKYFLLPVPETNGGPRFAPANIDNKNILYPYTPGSPDWLRWFQSRYGNEPMAKGSIALDYDMVLSFQALPVWGKCTDPKNVSSIHGQADNYRKLTIGGGSN